MRTWGRGELDTAEEEGPQGMDAGQADKITWTGKESWLETGRQAFKSALAKVRHPVYVVRREGQTAVTTRGRLGASGGDQPVLPLAAWVPGLVPQNLGSAAFKRRHGLRFAYVMGAMAHGISSVEMVKAAAREGMLAFFGAGGLPLAEIEDAAVVLKKEGGLPFGFNLIHSPSDPELEKAVVETYLRRKISLVSASAFMNLTLPLVYYRVAGLVPGKDGRPVCTNRIVAKVSREELAQKFLSPPPSDMVAALLEQGLVSAEQAELAAKVPMADDLTAEADSGGHTDNRPALALLPTFIALRDKLCRQFKFSSPPEIGLAGGIASPQAVAAAFAMGAAYVLTGSINQACVEAGTSDTVKQMLAQARQADVTMAPAGDMFELGVKVQVLKRGTMFAMRAGRLYDLYSRYDNWQSLPQKERLFVERQLLKCSFEEAWQKTAAFFRERDPVQVELADRDPKHKMALVFRSYLGRASIWARQGIADRVIDYQIWCGPAMGAFNQWTAGSFMEVPQNRRCVEVALNLLYGASVLNRAVSLANQGIALTTELFKTEPMPLERIKAAIQA